jgi:hypothetical protein
MKNDLMLSASDLALTAGDTPDLPTTIGARAVLLAPLSRALDTSSDSFLVGAAAGDFVIYCSGGDPKIVKGAIGFTCMVIGFDRPWIEYPNKRGDDIIRHLKRPSDVDWRDRGEGGAEQFCHYRIGPNGELGNRVVDTGIAYLLIEGIDEMVSLSFTKTALRLSYNGFVDTAQKLAIRGGPDGLQWVTGCTLGKFRITSRLIDDANRRWHVPKVTLIGKLGEEGGPSVEEWRKVQGLRMAAKAPPPVPLASPPVAPLVAGPPAPPTAAAEYEYLDDRDLEPQGVVDDAE